MIDVIDNNQGMLKENTTFHGNPTLKRINEPISLTHEQFLELKRCSEDVLYFAENYMYIVNVDKGKCLLKLYPYQKEVLKTINDNRKTVILSARQTGKTTITTAFLLWYVLFNEDKKCALLANKGSMAREIMSRIQMAYMNLPKFLQQGIVSYNKSTIELENGSKLIAAATSSDSVRGSSFSCVYLDECAFVPTNVFEKFWLSTYPTISSGKETKLIISSTPNGQNHFWKFYTNAVNGKNDMVPVTVNWWDVPGRDEEWRKNQLMIMSEKQFAQEYGNSFDTSTNTLISGDIIQYLNEHSQLPLQSTKTSNIYELPIPEHRYLLTVDCASVGIDFSTISIIDVTKTPYKQVATYYDDTISHILFPQIILNYATKYNDAQVLCENNEIGSTILHILYRDLEYENVIKTYSVTRGISILGQRTTTKTKSSGCARLKDMLETSNLILFDKKTINELGHFVLNESSLSYSAEVGFHDDMVMGLVNFAYFASTQTFRLLYDDSNFIDEYMKQKEEEMYEQLSPLPLFSGNNYGEEF